jgi:hypothetical protein
MVEHCCEDMVREVEQACGQHPNRFDCSDCIVHYSAARHEYGLIVHDGGESFIRIQFCPWCGTTLTVSAADNRQEPESESR